MSSGPAADAEPIDALVALVERSGAFDAGYYRAQRPDLTELEDPLRHYLESGWRDGLSPSPSFDTAYYLAMNDDVRVNGMNPLVHFLRYGRAVGRFGTGPAPHETVNVSVPSAAEWAALRPRPEPYLPLVDVIVPVYRGFAETLRCIYSVLAAPVATVFELWVIDDAGPQRELRDALHELAAAGRIRLFRNPENRGFVRSANFAMRLHPARDVVLLNSDAEVFGDWLDRLRFFATLPGVGTVTPFSNNAEICSYPRFLRDTDRRLELPDAELDALAAAVNHRECADLPTAVGFCMYVKRACLDAVGWFDEVHFGTGYGEENDFSRRAVRAGWRNVLAADVFVRHRGGTSFGAAKAQRLEAAYATVSALHPEYPDVVRDFIAGDPIMEYRRRIDFARIKRWNGDRAFLFVTHNRGGGTERHAVDLAERIVADGGRVLFCRADEGAGERLRFEAPGLNVPNLPRIDVPAGLDAFVTAAAAMGVRHLHVHHLADLPGSAAEFFRAAAERLTISYDVTIHDYFFVCPRINLIDDSGFYCGEPDERGCARCLARAGSEFGAPEIRAWRERYGAFLQRARNVFVPDADVALRLQRYFSARSYVVRPHPEDTRAFAGTGTATSPPRHPARRRVGLIGAIGAHKGSRLLLECARSARDRAVPLDFSVIGYTDIDAQLSELGVTITGAYAERELEALIRDARLDVAWFPSVWPETYCYTMSAALRARVFPVVFDLGALAARLRSLGWGHVLPLELFFDPERVVDTIAALEMAPFPTTAEAGAGARSSFIADYYGFSSPDPEPGSATEPARCDTSAQRGRVIPFAKARGAAAK